VARRYCATLHVDPRNEAAIKLYTSLGFELDGVLEDYYSLGCPAHKLILSCEQS
jgi:ribosomal protein S18 acetylase RimI-like enzyme